jgi:predicted RNA-binding Zn-ribbon protein involved in translation (DUF1610 family)
MEKRDYEGALYYLMTETAQLNGGKIVPLSQSAIDDLQELVKRNEPMKVDLKTKYVLPYSGTYYECPKCGKTVIGRYYNYCGNCGQRLAWSWSDEK